MRQWKIRAVMILAGQMRLVLMVVVRVDWGRQRGEMRRVMRQWESRWRNGAVAREVPVHAVDDAFAARR